MEHLPLFLSPLWPRVVVLIWVPLVNQQLCKKWSLARFKMLSPNYAFIHIWIYMICKQDLALNNQQGLFVIRSNQSTFTWIKWCTWVCFTCHIYGVMVKVQDCGFEVTGFVLQSYYYVHFRINTRFMVGPAHESSWTSSCWFSSISAVLGYRTSKLTILKRKLLTWIYSALRSSVAHIYFIQPWWIYQFFLSINPRYSNYISGSQNSFPRWL